MFAFFDEVLNTLKTIWFLITSPLTSLVNTFIYLNKARQVLSDVETFLPVFLSGLLVFSLLILIIKLFLDML